jgi:hypothetical protein
MTGKYRAGLAAVSLLLAAIVPGLAAGAASAAALTAPLG